MDSPDPLELVSHGLGITREDGEVWARVLTHEAVSPDLARSLWRTRDQDRRDWQMILTRLDMQRRLPVYMRSPLRLHQIFSRGLRIPT